MSLVKAVVSMQLTVTESVSVGAPFANSTNNQVVHDLLNEGYTLTPSSAIAATLVSTQQLALVAGVATIDLTNIPGLESASQTANGLKLRALKARNNTGNTAGHLMTLSNGTSNGYQPAGANWSMPLLPGQGIELWCKDVGQTVGGTHKNIDIVGTGTDVLDLILVFGP